MAGASTGVQARVEWRTGTGKGTRSRVILADADGLVAATDVTGGLVAAIAHALWQSRGGDDLTNWADAEAVLDQLLAPRAAPPEVKPVGAERPTRRASSRR